MYKNIKQKLYNTLRRSEHWTHTDMVYIAKGGAWLTAARIVASISSFLMVIAFANLLTKEAYGLYQYVLSIVGILSISTLGGINTALTQAMARGYEGSIIPALKTRIHWGVIGGIGSIPGAVLGGLILGLLESFGTQLPFIGSEWKDVFAFGILILLLLFKPTGLLGKTEIERM